MTSQVVAALTGAASPLSLPRDSSRPAPCLANLAAGHDYGGARVFAATVGPGDCIFMPRGWAHEVFTLAASVSLTYNFLHVSNAAGWPGWRWVPRKVARRLRLALG